MKRFLNVAIVVSFFSLVAAIIWLVWEPRVIVLNVVATALIVFMTLMLCKLISIIAKELWR